ncbi:hypothetical protein QWT69_14170 [Sporosarcina oncorhynchi]|uniref:Lycopene cyclase domain-containing protein n=1 Tax=Sporosarcina oncorhynchi TaxID=3056444 RepID=A0ABZ0L4B7_9BACL|nr:hypothetical protein [Sporosarcina sp. T2O-4]WOV87005.1 hypothetical protein QWT69_14170 [Sporosarcina sp. T2O-4]
MKVNNYAIMLLIVYCVPFVFLSMYDDYKNYSMIVYGITLVIIVFFAFLAKRKSSLMVLITANILSFLSSYFWVKRMDEMEDWGYYFKPLEPSQLVMLVTVLGVLLQLIVFLLTKRVGYKKDDVMNR